jgi:hypothetical protein
MQCEFAYTWILYDVKCLLNMEKHARCRNGTPCPKLCRISIISCTHVTRNGAYISLVFHNASCSMWKTSQERFYQAIPRARCPSAARTFTETPSPTRQQTWAQQSSPKFELIDGDSHARPAGGRNERNALHRSCRGATVTRAPLWPFLTFQTHRRRQKSRLARGKAGRATGTKQPSDEDLPPTRPVSRATTVSAW